MPFIPINCGKDGAPHYMKSPYDTGTFTTKVMRILEENIRKDNFYYTEANDDFGLMEDLFEDEFDENKVNKEKLIKEIEFYNKLRRA